MFIQIGDNEYELKTNLGIAKKIENRYKLSPMQVFDNLAKASTDELQGMLCIAAGKVGDKALIEEMDESWGYATLFVTVQELLAQLLFPGTPDEQEAAIDKHPLPETQKNAFREMLGLPIKTAPEDFGSE